MVLLGTVVALCKGLGVLVLFPENYKALSCYYRISLFGVLLLSEELVVLPTLKQKYRGWYPNAKAM